MGVLPVEFALEDLVELARLELFVPLMRGRVGCRVERLHRHHHRWHEEGALEGRRRWTRLCRELIRESVWRTEVREKATVRLRWTLGDGPGGPHEPCPTGEQTEPESVSSLHDCPHAYYSLINTEPARASGVRRPGGGGSPKYAPVRGAATHTMPATTTRCADGRVTACGCTIGSA